MNRFVKVKHPALKRSVYLENPREFVKGNHRFISGYVCDKFGEPKIVKGGDVIHLLEVDDTVRIIPQKFNNKYAELEDA